MAYNNFNFTESGYTPSYDFDFSPITTYTVLAGTSSTYVAIWADSDANISNSRMYVATAGTGAALSVIGLENKVLMDSYSTSNGGAFDEVLEQENIKDINVR